MKTMIYLIDHLVLVIKITKMNAIIINIIKNKNCSFTFAVMRRKWRPLIKAVTMCHIKMPRQRKIFSAAPPKALLPLANFLEKV